MLGFVALSQRERPGELTEYALDRLIQWAQYLVHMSDIQIAMRADAVPVGPATRAPWPELPAPDPPAPERVPRSSGASPTVGFTRVPPARGPPGQTRLHAAGGRAPVPLLEPDLQPPARRRLRLLVRPVQRLLDLLS